MCGEKKWKMAANILVPWKEDGGVFGRFIYYNLYPPKFISVNCIVYLRIYCSFTFILWDDSKKLIKMTYLDKFDYPLSVPACRRYNRKVDIIKYFTLLKKVINEPEIPKSSPPQSVDLSNVLPLPNPVKKHIHTSVNTYII